MEELLSVTIPTTLDHLPTSLHRGLSAVAFFGLLALTASLTLFGCLTYRLAISYRRGHFKNGTNQLLVLIYNLVIADILHATAFSLTTIFVANNKIEVGTSACFANGYFISVGRLASSVFIFSIALHTFFAVVKGRNVSDRVLYLWLAGAWLFIHVLATLTISLNPNAYVRAGAWCWIDRKYETARFWLHFFWLFACMFGTVAIYIIIYFALRTRLVAEATDDRELATIRRAETYMIIYPTVYVVCTLPLAAGRMAVMTGIKFPYWYYCVAGAMITSVGWLNVITYAIIHRAIIFSNEPPEALTGLHAFGWYNGHDFYGTTTTVEGPLTKKHSFARPSDAGIETASSRWTWLPWKCRRGSEDEYFATPLEGVITTKTTIEVTSGPVLSYLESKGGKIVQVEDMRNFSTTPTLCETIRNCAHPSGGVTDREIRK